MESLRFNYDNWKVWENIVLVSMDTGHVEDVVRGVHRLLDLRDKYDDLEVLTLLVRAIVDRQEGLGDADSAARYMVLVTLVNSKANSGSWPNNPDTCMKVMELTQLLLEHSLKARQDAVDNEKQQADQQLSSARLTGQAVIRAVEKQDWPETKTLLEELKNIFNTVTDYMKSIM
ncbi:Tetratricopeptide repeat protein 27 [Papilio machaon]|uniref:Tetratricopeptide repeat protein 27 n=1 Tax=Papilio machaon TaxID=76193 RepID=A0A194RP29_PAPMA|nr:Tetratricopeptide repeat protein 27 [Papilio machaon]